MRKLTDVALALTLSVALVAPALGQDAARARNVILMITDGAGIETFRAASYYRHGALGYEVYDDFEVQVFVSTHPLNTELSPTRSNEGRVRFDPAMLWQREAVDTVFEGRLRDYPGAFSGYDYARDDYTDSAAAGTALASGRKTYNNAINWSNDDEAMKHVGEYVVESGRSLGVVSSVPWSHATPAAFLAHNASRDEYGEIAREIVEGGLASVVMGAGHPGFGENGEAASPGEQGEEDEDDAFGYVGGEDVWNRLAAGQTQYRLIESREEFEALAGGRLDLRGKDKVLGTARVSGTLQFGRDGVSAGDRIATVPDLAAMALGALNIVSRDEDGFFLMVEGGAVDWAAHANNLPRIIEEQVDFNLAVEAVADWIEENGAADDTLLIVTTDHGNGLLQGLDAYSEAYQGVINQGAGALPLVRWNSDTHTRELVPLYARGPGAEYFADVARSAEGLSIYGVPPASRVYVDNTDVFGAVTAAMGIDPDVIAPAR